MTKTTRALGDAGEACAAAYLYEQGYTILGRNLRADGVELDIVAKRRRTIAIVEVKTRRSRFAGDAAEAVDARKRARLVRGAAAWLHAHPQRGCTVRFDVIVCEPGARGLAVQHWPGAFDAGD